jgi:TP901 family phage tail tape measure protein
MADRDLRLKMIFQMSEKLTGPMRAVSVGSKAMAKELKASSDQLDHLQRVQNNISSFRAMKAATGQAAQEMKTAELRVAALAKAIAGVDTPTKKMTAEFAKAKREASALKDRHTEQQRALQGLRTGLNDAGVSTGNLSSHERTLRTDIARTTAVIDEQKTKLGALADREAKMASGKASLGKSQQLAGNMAVGGTAAVGAGFVLGAPVLKASQDAMIFESRMIDIKKVLNDVSPAQLKKIETGILNMSTRVPIVAEGLGQIAAEGARAGIAAKDLLSFTEGAAKMAAAFDIAAEEAGAMQAKWQTGMSLTIPQIQILGDKVNALTNKFGGSAAAVTDMITRVGPLGKVAGVASGEMAAMAQLMNSAGVEAEIGATGIKRMMIVMNTGAAATKSQSAAFESLGIDAVVLAKRMQVDARGGILSVLDAINQLPKDQQISVLTQLFGSESLASIAPMLGGLDELKRNFNLVGNEANYAGSMNREFGVAMSKTENQMKTGGNSIGMLSTVMGKQLLPAISVGIGYVKSIAIGMAGWMQQHPGLTRAIGLTVGVIAALLIVVGSLAIGAASIIGPFALLRYSFLLAGPVIGSITTALGGLRMAFVAVGRTFLMNPIVATIAVIAAGAYLIWKNWDRLGPWFQGLWNQASNAITGFLNKLDNINWGLFSERIINFFDHATQKVFDLVAGIDFTALGVTIGNKIVAWFSNVNWTRVGQIIWSGIKIAFKIGFLVISTILKVAATLIIAAFIAIGAAMFGAMRGAWNKVTALFSSAWAGIKSKASGWATSMWGIGVNIVNGIVGGIKAAPGAVWEALKGVVFAGITGIKNFLGIKSPSRLFMGIGGHMVDGLTVGIGGRGPKPIAALAALSRGMSKAIVATGTAGAIAAAPAYANNGPRDQQGGNQYTIIVKVAAGGQNADEARIADAVRREIDAIEAEKGARARSRFADNSA